MHDVNNHSQVLLLKSERFRATLEKPTPSFSFLNELLSCIDSHAPQATTLVERGRVEVPPRPVRPQGVALLGNDDSTGHPPVVHVVHVHRHRIDAGHQQSNQALGNNSQRPRPSCDPCSAWPSSSSFAWGPTLPSTT
ncbi:unnamed protein product, partial [Ectocarpus sp. 12 AP-2014]